MFSHRQRHKGGRSLGSGTAKRVKRVLALDEELRQKITELMDETVRAFGPQSWNEAIDGLIRLAEWFLQNVDSLRVDSIMKLLEDVPMEGDDAEQRQARVEFLREVFQQVPSLTRSLAIELAGRAKQNLPPSPGGRPRIATPERAQAVCGFIGRLFGQGVPLQAAKQRAAQRFALSQRTVDRIWAQRGKQAAPVLDLRAIALSVLTPEVPEGGH